MGKKIGILQPNYIPWKGVFEMINKVDTFVILDDVQYTKNDWRNRNKIKTVNGSEWITVPVLQKNSHNMKIYEAEIDNRYNWQRKHYNAFITNYSKAPFFKMYKWILEDLYIEKKWNNIAEVDIYAIKSICKLLDIQTEIILSREVGGEGAKEDRVIDICKKLNAKLYITGPAAKDYIEPNNFLKNGINLEYMEYNYSEYKQLYEPFDHYVTVLDVLFNCGEEAKKYILKK